MRAAEKNRCNKDFKSINTMQSLFFFLLPSQISVVVTFPLLLGTRRQFHFVSAQGNRKWNESVPGPLDLLSSRVKGIEPGRTCSWRGRCTERRRARRTAARRRDEAVLSERWAGSLLPGNTRQHWTWATTQVSNCGPQCSWLDYVNYIWPRRNLRTQLEPHR